MADTTTEVEKKTPTLVKPETGFHAQTANSLASPDTNVPKSGPSEIDKANAKNYYGTCELTDRESGSSPSTNSLPRTLANPYGSLPGMEILSPQADAGLSQKADSSLAPKPEASATKNDATPGTKSDATTTTTAENPAMDGAHEVIKDAAGNDKLVPLGKLESGDHTIALKDGREFMMHVPPNDGKEKLPVMFMFSGSGEGQWNIKDFVPESGMNTKADDPKNKFIAVYPLPERHLLGTGSDKTAYGWNVLDKNGGVLIDKADSAKAGYDDLAYVKDIAKLVQQVANVDATHKDWAAVGFSQGGVFVNYLASNAPNLFPTVSMIGSGLDTKYNYDVKQGNAQNVDIINLRGDQGTMPFLNNTNKTFKIEEALRDILPKDVFEKMDDLAPINNSESDPAKQMAMYEGRLGKSVHHTSLYATPYENTSPKDSVTRYIPKDRNNHDRVTIVDLANAQHSFPEADPSNKRTNATPKYTEFDTDQQIVDTWFKFNKGQTK